MDIRRWAGHPGGRVGALILAVMMLVVSSGLFAGQRAQAAAPSDKVISQPVRQTVTEAKPFSKEDRTSASGKSPGQASTEAPLASPSGPQATSNYTFATATNGSLTDMSTGTTTLLAANIDDTASALTNIGFDFYFQGARFTQFSVNDNGVLRLGATAQTSTPYKPLAQAGLPILTAYGADQRTHAGDGKIHFKVIGSAPNRTLVVEWLNNQSTFNTGSTADLTYQVRLAETTGVIQYVYGSMTMSAAGAADTNSRDPNIGFSSSNVAGTVGSVTAPQSGTPAPTYDGSSATPVANLYTAGTITVLHSTTDGSRRVFTFTPPTPTAPTNLTFTAVTASAMTLNWTDSPNELIYAIYRSTDGTNYTFVNTAAQNATSFNAAGLAQSTNYFWQVYAVSEGALSSALSGSQMTAAAPTIVSTSVGGLWSVPATWVGGVVPSANDNVTIADGATVTIDVTTATCLNLTVGQGTSGTLQYIATPAATLTVNGDATVANGATFTAGTGSLTTHILNIGGSASSLAAGNLTVNGTFDMNTTAGVTTNFLGSGDGSVTGSGATCDFFAIVVNKGSTITPILDVTRIITVNAPTGSASRLTVNNGTFKLSSASTITPYAGSNTIAAATGRLWINNAGASITSNGVGTTSNAGSPTIAGTLRVDAGTFGYGSGNNTMTVSSGASLIIGGSAATVNMFGAVSFTSGASFTMTAGNFNVDPQAGNQLGSTVNVVRFNTVTVSFTGGTLTIVDPHNAASATGKELSISASSAATFNFAGSTIRFGDGVSSTAGSTDGFEFDTFVGTALVPLGNVTVDNPATNAATRFVKVNTALAPFQTIFGGNLNITNAGGSQFRLNGNLVGIGGNVINNGTLDGTVTNSRLYFLGIAPQTYTGAGAVTVALLQLDLDNPTGLTIDPASPNIVLLRVNLFRGTITNSNKLTLGTGGASSTVVQIGVSGGVVPGGSFDVSPTYNVVNTTTGGHTILYQQESVARTTGFEIPPSRSAYEVVVNNTNGVTLSGGDLTMTSVNTPLTLTNGRFITGANTIIIGSGTGTVARTSGYVDGNFRKNYAATAAKTFEVGTANGYSPVVITTTAGTFPTDITAKAVQGPMPSVPAPTLSLQRYWTLTATGVTADLLFTYLDPTDIPPTATEANLSIFKYNGATLTQQAGTVNTTNNTFVVTGVSSFSDWTLSTFTQWASAIEGAGASLAAPSVYWDNATPTPNTFITTGGNSGSVKGLDGAGGILWSQNVGGAVQDRGPIVPITGTNVSYFTSQNGWVNALRATDGTSFWPAGVGQIASSVVGGVAYQPNVAVTGGPTSLIFAGTFTDTTLTNRMVALNALTGAQVWSFDNSANGGLGTIPTGPAVDWISNTLYFGTNNVTGPVKGPGEGLVNGPVGVWALNTTNGAVRWSQSNIGAVVNSFPTLSRDGKTLYVGTINAGVFTLYALRTSDGAIRASFQAPGGVGDFRGSPWLWPNSANPANTDIYATAGDRVYAFTDTPATTGTLPFKSGWATGFATVPGAGTPLFLPTTNNVYVGGNNGTIYKINANTGVISNQFFLGAVAAVSDLTYDYVRNTFYLTTNGKLYSIIGNW